jgi:hypothetical protein
MPPSRSKKGNLSSKTKHSVVYPSIFKNVRVKATSHKEDYKISRLRDTESVISEMYLPAFVFLF